MSIVIDISKLRNKAGVKETIELVINEIDFPEDITLFKPLVIKIEIANTGFIYDLKGTLGTELKTTCSRCLENVIVPLESTFDEMLINTTDLSKLGDISLKQIEEDYRIFDKDDSIDITAIVVEHIFTALPFKFLCSNDCKGLCPRCSKNLNKENCNCIIEEIDPRLAILANLKQD